MEKRGSCRDEWVAPRRSVCPEIGQGRRWRGDGHLCVSGQAEECWAHLDQSAASRPAIQSLFSCLLLLISSLFVNL